MKQPCRVYRPIKTFLLSSTSLLIKPIAVIFVARGQGLMAVISPKSNAVNTGMELFSSKVLRNSSIIRRYLAYNNGLIFSEIICFNFSGLLRAYIKPSFVILILVSPLTINNVCPEIPKSWPLSFPSCSSRL